ncbi:MAG: carboxypeptidase-like regulatory domain-containing protein [Bacteroidota bacterium]
MIPTINAQVISAAGTPLSEIVVTIAAGPGQFPDIGLLTDEQGRFTLHDLVAGTYRLNFAGSSAVVQQSIHLTPDTTEIIIRLEEF